MKIVVISLSIGAGLAACNTTVETKPRQVKALSFKSISLEIEGPLPNKIPGMVYRITIKNPQQIPFCIGAEKGLYSGVSLTNSKTGLELTARIRPSTETGVYLLGDLDPRQPLSAPITDVVLTKTIVDKPFVHPYYETEAGRSIEFNATDRVTAMAYADIYGCKNETISQAIQNSQSRLLSSKPTHAFQVERDTLPEGD
ncbi:hypothetical protein [Aliiroseovarius lamellibrachiae]|uniref:hypothetical protein n=1 Tax=Aliiroseovarius lamellibrachiae TaxID=1924933 RepID=UPI001BE00E9A|nr:hypothetical protein [Aliiroseovarius lamellibrachiae]MBT2132626.1 hypothetical protein [Aliiroseovarius lamellibrachiae]